MQKEQVLANAKPCVLRESSSPEGILRAKSKAGWRGVARPLHSVLRKNYGFSPLVYTDAPHCEGSFQGGFQVDQREVSARERGGPWAGGALEAGPEQEKA